MSYINSLLRVNLTQIFSNYYESFNLFNSQSPINSQYNLLIEKIILKQTSLYIMKIILEVQTQWQKYISLTTLLFLFDQTIIVHHSLKFLSV